VARPLLHEPDAILDAACELVARGGRRAATVSAISARSRAPSGSLYHRFGSHDRLLLEAWIRAIRRFQAGFLTALATGRPKEAAVAAALWTPRFAEAHRADATMLLNYRREDLLRNPVTDHDLLADVTSLNEPVEKALRRHAARVYGRIGRAGYEALTLAVVDLPYGAVRRHLSVGQALPAGLPQQLDAAVRAALDAGPKRSRRRPPARS
jgi:AcrR family transcriptional regulator